MTFIGDAISIPQADTAQSLIDAAEVLRVIVPHIDVELHIDVLPLYICMISGAKSNFAVVRHMLAQVVATMTASMCDATMETFIERVVPSLNDANRVHVRQGAIEMCFDTMTFMGTDILPYLVFLIIPVLGRMSDSNTDIRTLATHCFAELVKLVPLEAGTPDPKKYFAAAPSTASRRAEIHITAH